MPSWMAWAVASPAIRPARVRPMSIPADTPAAVTYLPSTTTRSSVRSAPQSASCSAASQGVVGCWFTLGALAVNAWPVRYARDQVLRADPDTWAATWAALAQVDTLRRLPSLRMPTRLMTGELDPSTPPRLMAEIAAQVPGGRLTVIDGGPHMLSLERPRELAAALVA